MDVLLSIIFTKKEAERSAKRAVYSMAMEDVYLRKSTCRMLVRLLAKDPENEELEAKLYIFPTCALIKLKAN